MLFMGEEWNARQPFPFFCNFGGELGGLVTKGRRQEFAAFPEFQDETKREQIPDPESEATFAAAILDWSARHRAPHREWLSWHRAILKVRAREISPRLASIACGGTYESLGERAVVVRWNCNGEALVLAANLSAQPATHAAKAGRIIWYEGESTSAADLLPPCTVRWSIERQ
jgi:1,4-alpha-glucan branching enzyme